jgi:hypothetical protein
MSAARVRPTKSVSLVTSERQWEKRGNSPLRRSVPCGSGPASSNRGTVIGVKRGTLPKHSSRPVSRSQPSPARFAAGAPGSGDWRPPGRSGLSTSKRAHYSESVEPPNTGKAGCSGKASPWATWLSLLITKITDFPSPSMFGPSFVILVRNSGSRDRVASGGFLPFHPDPGSSFLPPFTSRIAQASPSSQAPAPPAPGRAHLLRWPIPRKRSRTRRCRCRHAGSR